MHNLSKDIRQNAWVDGKEIWVPSIPYPLFVTSGLPLWKRVSEKYWRPQCECKRIFDTLEDYDAHIVYMNSPYAPNNQNKEEQMKLRDILAVPFWLVGDVLNHLAVGIGSRWTAQMFREHSIKVAQALKENK